MDCTVKPCNDVKKEIVMLGLDPSIHDWWEFG
jgi:hypothetical protein